MKKNRLHIYKRSLITLIWMIGSACLLPAGGSARGIRVVPKAMYVKNDSLRLQIQMDLNEVRTGNGTAVIFTPVIRGKGRQALALPPVIVSGTRRARQDRREAALSRKAGALAPYATLREDRREAPKTVDYQIAVPYASWMRDAALLLRQESKECCGPELLAIDTLSQSLALSVAAAAIPMEAGTGHRRKVQIREITLNATEVSSYASMVSSLIPDPSLGGKRRTENVLLYFDYPVNKDDIYPEFGNNRAEIEKIDRIMRPLLDNRFSSVTGVSICGYSSPEGAYGDNERLAKARSTLFANYMRKAYGVPLDLFEISSVAEDWEGVINLLQQANPPYKDAALAIIREYGIFKGREKQLMELQGGIPYKDMLQRFFPKLRRIEVEVLYETGQVSDVEASQLIYTHPDLLSLGEMYEVARLYRPGTEQYREVYEVAAFHFPDDVIANVNAASAVMLTGDLKSAWEYLKKVEADPRSWNNLGVLSLLEGDPEGAAVWFRKAVGIEPVKARNNLMIVSGMIEK